MNKNITNIVKKEIKMRTTTQFQQQQINRTD